MDAGLRGWGGGGGSFVSGYRICYSESGVLCATLEEMGGEVPIGRWVAKQRDGWL